MQKCVLEKTNQASKVTADITTISTKMVPFLNNFLFTLLRHATVPATRNPEFS